MSETRRRRAPRAVVSFCSATAVAAAVLVLSGGPVSAADDAPTPQITSITANHGPAAGRNEVVIRGTNLDAVSVFQFDGWAATPIVQRPDVVVVEAGPGLAGATIDVRVVTPEGVLPARPGPEDDYRYDGPTRYPLSVSPAHGPSSGGNTVTITAPEGADLSDAETVQFGVGRARILARAPRSLTVMPPGGAPLSGTPVFVTGEDGHTDGRRQEVYAWDAAPGPPVVTGVTPGINRFSGELITVRGQHLEGATEVIVAGQSAGAVDAIESEPGGPLWVAFPDEGGFRPGSYGLQLTGPTGTSVLAPESTLTILPDGPQPVVTSVEPAVIPKNVPTDVVIRGDHLTGALDTQWTTLVSGGSTSEIEVISDEEIRVKSPVFSQSGNVRLQVMTRTGSWSTLSPALEVGPAVPVSISPAQGAIHGGEHIAITANPSLIGAVGAVKFGDQFARIVTRTATALTVAAPAHAAGSSSVALIPSNDAGARLNPPGDLYTWVDAPTGLRKSYVVKGVATLPTIARGPLQLRGRFDVDYDRAAGTVSGRLQLNPVTTRLVTPSSLPVTGRVALVASGSATGTSSPDLTQMVARLRVKLLDAKLFGAIPLALGNACQSRRLSEVPIAPSTLFDRATGGIGDRSTFDVSDLNGCTQIASSFISSTASTGTIRLDLNG